MLDTMLEEVARMPTNTSTPCCRRACPAHIHIGGVREIEAYVASVVKNDSVMQAGSSRRLCDGHGLHGHDEGPDWVVSLAAAESLEPACLAAFFQVLQTARKGVLLAWGLSRPGAAQAGSGVCCPTSSPQRANPLSIMSVLNWRLHGPSQTFAVEVSSASGHVSIGLNSSLTVDVWKRHLPREEAALLAGTSANCKAKGTNPDTGAFTLHMMAHQAWGPWPLKDHHLDLGVGLCVASAAAGATVLDVGGGSGQYGALFHMLNASATEPPLDWMPKTQFHRVIRPGRGWLPAPSAWMTFDGTPGIENFTRTYGPPGALAREANICDPATRLPVHDWVLSLEVGEHLPTWCLANYVALLHRSNRKGIVLSWSAIAAGSCHINSKPPYLVASAIRGLGYVEVPRLQCRPTLS